VLDTWFSSWLWPFSVLGWESPESKTDDLERFYPTTALVTAYDIIFFWVARMIMAGLEFTGKAPFRDIYIHGLIRDKQGRKMSKTLGNGLDPLELVDEFGADALKFTLAFMCAQGQDLLVDRESFKMGSRFANKIWNASRYILMNLEGRSLVKDPGLLPADRWIYSRLNGAARAMTEAFLSYRYNDAAQKAYEFFWNDFCDWYVEATKLSIKSGNDSEKDRATTVLLDVLSESLRLLHPLLPFVTEEIYGKLRAALGGDAADGNAMLINAPYPVYDEQRNDPAAEEDFGFLQELVALIRTLRSECPVTPEKKLRVLARTERGKLLGENAEMVKLLAGIGTLEIVPGEGDRPQGSIAVVGSAFEAFVYIAEAVDMAQLKEKFARDIERDRKFIASLEAKLANAGFVKNAPPELVAGEKQKLEDALKRNGKLESYIRDMA
jgi:valyl-tRNA synthetase